MRELQRIEYVGKDCHLYGKNGQHIHITEFDATVLYGEAFVELDFRMACPMSDHLGAVFVEDGLLIFSNTFGDIISVPIRKFKQMKDHYDKQHMEPEQFDLEYARVVDGYMCWLSAVRYCSTLTARSGSLLWLYNAYIDVRDFAAIDATLERARKFVNNPMSVREGTFEVSQADRQDFLIRIYKREESTQFNLPNGEITKVIKGTRLWITIFDQAEKVGISTPLESYFFLRDHHQNILNYEKKESQYVFAVTEGCSSCDGRKHDRRRVPR